MSLTKSDGETLAAAEVNTFPQKAAAESITGVWSFDLQAVLNGAKTANVPMIAWGSANGTSTTILFVESVADTVAYKTQINLNGSTTNSSGIIWHTSKVSTPPGTYFLGILRDELNFQIVSDPNGTPKVALGVDPNANVIMPNLPTSDPAISGALWNDSGTLKVSA